MPLHRLSRITRPQLLDVRRALEKEWRNPTPTDDAQPSDPVIYESDSPDGPVELHVVWDRWEGIPHHERSEIILDAYESVRGEDNLMRMAGVWGFTPREAEQMQLPAPSSDVESP